MRKSAGIRARLALALITAAVVAACSNESPVAGASVDQPLVASGAAAEFHGPDLGTCTNLQPPEGSRLQMRLFAKGVQIYKWSGTAWTFVAPSADLYLTKLAFIRVGTHYAGPSWEMVGGSKVTGALLDKCPVAPADIPWLILKVSSDSGRGVLQGATHIQRVNTVGGIAPAAAGTVVGEERRIPYKAEYYFYRAP